jgi:protein-L-isoaspartate(D-aspartate) O-methyltransferase
MAKMNIASKKTMIEAIKNYGMTNERILSVMESIPRHRFVPKSLQDLAYLDRPLPIGSNQTISQPYIVAYMTDQLNVAPTHRVLEIGTGSGYQAAVLGKLAKEVYTIEIVKDLYKTSTNLLKELGYPNIYTKYGDGYEGWPQKAPFDRIILTASPPTIPPPLIEQLAPRGILIAPEGVGYQKIILIKKDAQGNIHKQNLIPVRFVPMTGKSQQ